MQIEKEGEGERVRRRDRRGRKVEGREKKVVNGGDWRKVKGTGEGKEIGRGREDGREG